jgi:hypothetical protein
MRRGARTVGALLSAIALVTSVAGLEPNARADDAADAPDERSPPPPRQVPSYDGRAPAPATAGDAALWIPRVLLFPLYLVSVYLVRRPLGWLISKAEADNWPSAVLDFFSFDSERNSGLVPTAFVDFGFRPSVGLYFFSNGAFTKKNDLRLFASTGGIDWLSLGATDRVHLWSVPAPGGGVSSEGVAEVHVSFLRRADYQFFGFGPESRPDDGGRYSADRFEVGPAFDLLPTRLLRYRSGAGLRMLRYEDSCCMSPTVLDRVGAGTYPLPDGFARDYTIAYASNQIIFDTRPRRPRSQTGLRVEVHGEHDTSLRGPANAWIKYGGAIGGFLDVTGNERVLGLTLETEFADPIVGAAPPFGEQVQLGGSGMMRGFRPGRLTGRSGAAATLSYEWPIWAFLDGAMHAALGNAWGPGLRGFEPGLLRLSSGIGIRTRNSPDHQFEALFGFGTEPLEQGVDVSQFRFMVGATRGF